MKCLSLIFLLALSQMNFAKCVIQKDSLKVKWTAFKTPKKVGVGGSFTSFEYKGKESGKSLSSVLVGSTLTINSSKVNTGNPARDAKIAEYFFSNAMGDNKIVAEVKSLQKKTALLKVTMNNKEVEVPLTLSTKGGLLKGTGHLDILDFSMSKSLQAINRACYALHEGKTWSDVDLEVSLKAPGC